MKSLAREEICLLRSLNILIEVEGEHNKLIKELNNISESKVSISFRFHKQKALVTEENYILRSDCANSDRQY